MKNTFIVSGRAVSFLAFGDDGKLWRNYTRKSDITAAIKRFGGVRYVEFFSSTVKVHCQSGAFLSNPNINRREFSELIKTLGIEGELKHKAQEMRFFTA